MGESQLTDMTERELLVALTGKVNEISNILKEERKRITKVEDAIDEETLRCPFYPGKDNGIKLMDRVRMLEDGALASKSFIKGLLVLGAANLLVLIYQFFGAPLGGFPK